MAAEENGLVWKLSDEDSRQKPCDCLCVPALPAYLVVRFPEGLFYMIRIKDVVKIRDEGVISITEDKAQEVKQESERCMTANSTVRLSTSTSKIISLNKNNMTHYEEYAIIEAQIKELENKKDSLRGLILKEMVESGEESVDTAVGKFSVTKLKKWVYPQWVLDIKDEFDSAKARAESTKEATYTEKTTQTISFIHKEKNETGELVTVNDGTTNEEVLHMMVDRLTFLNDKMESPHNVITVKPPKKVAEKKPKAPKFKLVSYTVKAIIPTGMYANIQPEVTVEAESMEVAERAVMGHIEALFAKYRVDGPQAPQTPRPVALAPAPVQKAQPQAPVAPVATPTAPSAPVQTASAPVAPTPAPEAPVAPAITMSEPFRRAKSAIDSCMSHDALKLVSDQIEKSVKLIDTEKVELKNMVTVKYNDITIAGTQKA
ncbi:unnamed protein product [Wuchereria bancrofti]|uniref:Uncharacterized protein n=1 Tax=Wuchereria bancrofti TaxID=6293 RepID=A0A3P7E245_WUCBA|nr:unnamed protein product [Wuchereria bancrofti]